MEPFEEAARAFVAITRRVPSGGWDGPGLGEWDLRALVGHTSRALVTVETYLARPAATVAVESPAGYFRRASAADSAAVAERGRQAGASLGPDPATSVQALVDRVLPLVAAAGDPVVETIAGGMRLSDYLPTRTFELVVHGLDICAALGVDPYDHSPELLGHVLDVAGRVAVARGDGPALLRALTGRAPLPDGFCVV